MKKDNKNTLSENATLVRLTTKHPSGIKSDKDLKEGLAIDQKANNDSLHVAKYIFGKETNKYFRRIIHYLLAFGSFLRLSACRVHLHLEE